MHPVLLIDELVRIILQHCWDDDVCGARYRHTLYHCALTCKSFNAPAVDLLWTHLPSVVPLMTLIPGLYCDTDEGRFTLQRYMTCEEKTLFLSYARRVKSISQQKPFPLDPAVSHYVPFFLPDTNILVLPSLISASLSSTGFSTKSACLPVSPALRELRIRMDNVPSAGGAADEVLCGYMAQARAVAPGLASVFLRGRLCARTNALLAEMSGLESLSLRSVRSLAPSTLAAMAAFPRLTALHIRADHISLADFVPGPEVGSADEPRIFPALEQLTIRAHAPLIAHILTRLVPGRLRSLALDVVPGVPDSDDEDELPRAPERPDWDALLPLVVAKSAPGLRALTVEYHGAQEHVDPTSKRDCLTLASLRPLLALPELEYLALDLGLPWDLSDADVAALAHSWPRLAHLALETPLHCLESEHGWCWRPRVTLGTLDTLAARCAELVHLALAMDLTSRPSLAALAGAVPAAQHVLRTLNITSSSEPREPEKLAQHLHALFPALEDVDDGCEQAGRWRDVRLALRELQGIADLKPLL